MRNPETSQYDGAVLIREISGRPELGIGMIVVSNLYSDLYVYIVNIFSEFIGTSPWFQVYELVEFSRYMFLSACICIHTDDKKYAYKRFL